MALDGVHYSSIANDYTGSELENVVDRSVFDLTDNDQLLSPIFGLYNYLDLKPLQDFINAYGEMLINQADIETRASGTTKQQIPKVRYYFYDQEYGFRGEGIFSDAANTAVLANPSYIEGSSSLLIGNINDEGSAYVQDVTFFVEFYYSYYLSNDRFWVDGLIITPDQFVTLQETSLVTPSSTSIKLYVTSIN